ncbi:MAG TPA: glycosyltransferase family 2 protein [Candidatus Eisenbacteria bacterium]
MPVSPGPAEGTPGREPADRHAEHPALKLVIQIPCLNEEATLPATLADLPRAVPGVQSVEILVVDDGSSDLTSEVARAHGVTRVVRFAARQGLAAAFARGLQEALAMGADIIVNTDADNQYQGRDIPRLVAPILEGRADIVVGDRPIDSNPEFTPLKKILQRLGSSVVRRLSHTRVPDATSGFRAYTREAALRLTVLSGFTYTLETLIQATQKNLTIDHVPIRINPRTRESRLFRGLGTYVQRSVATMARIYILYQPLRAFLALSGVFLLAALLLFVRFLYFFFAARPAPSGHVQSLVIAGALAVIGVLVAALGILSDLTAMNRQLLEETLTNTRVTRYGGRGKPVARDDVRRATENGGPGGGARAPERPARAPGAEPGAS